VLDQVYVGLELDSDNSRRTYINLLQNPYIRAEFIGSLSSEILMFDSSDTEMQVKSFRDMYHVCIAWKRNLIQKSFIISEIGKDPLSDSKELVSLRILPIRYQIDFLH
jgi:hypothetical protein